MSRLTALTRPRRPGNRPKIRERDVLRTVLDLLAVKKIWHRRMNTGAVKAEGRFFRFGSVGMADALALPKSPCGAGCCPRPAEEDDAVLWELRHCQAQHPVPLWIECKSPGGRQSEAQRAFQAEVEAEGHSYLLVSDIDDLAAFLRERGL